MYHCIWLYVKTVECRVQGHTIHHPALLRGGVRLGRHPAAEPTWLVLHPVVYSDIDEIMGYYERVATA
jgi:hypothetical protein